MIAIKESNVTIMVKDMDKAVKFYEDLGLTIKNRWGNHYAQLTTTGITIGLHPGAADISPDGHMSIGFLIDDLEGAKQLLEKNGITSKLIADKAGDILNFKDPDGTMLYFMKMKW